MPRNQYLCMIKKTLFLLFCVWTVITTANAQYANQKYHLTFPSELSEENRQFVEMIIPEIVKANNEVLWIRQRIERISVAFSHDNEVTTTSLQFLQKISDNYKMNFEFSIYTTPKEFRYQIDQLLIRVDKVPEELVLAQAVLESEWGRSRFAREANNYFGIHCFKPGCGIVPEGASNASFMVRAYDSPLDGVRDYLYNINVGRAYRELRSKRALQRENGTFPNTLELAQTLHAYSEIGNDYYTRLSWLIRKKLPAIELVVMGPCYSSEVSVSKTTSISSLTDL